MAQATRTFSPETGQVWLPASATLAFQRMRQTWRMLCLVGLGILASVVVVCAAPLYAQVAMTSGLRSVLNANNQSTDMTVSAIAFKPSPVIVARVTDSLNQEFQRHLGQYLLPGQFSIQTPPFRITMPVGDQIEMTGVDTAQAASHLQFAQGRIPGEIIHGNTIEIAVRAELASLYSWRVGTVIPIGISYGDPSSNIQIVKPFNLQVVGIFAPLKSNDIFWHGSDFLGSSSPDGQTFIASSLTSNTALLSLFNQTSANTPPMMTFPSSLNWYYDLNASRIQVDQIDTILSAMRTIQVDNANSVMLNGLSSFQHVQTYLPSSALTLYHDRLPIVQFPVTSLTLLVLALTLFFVTLMTGILVDRQAGALALLRSRGASGGQIFWSMVTQAGLLGLVALLIGPLLAVELVRLLAEHILTATDQSALNTLNGNPFVVALSTGSYALVATGAMVLTMVLAIWSTTNRDVLALRRESARATHRPFWQRLNLDALAIAVALLGAGFSIYLTNSNTLDIRLRLLLLSPLTLLEAIFVLLAAILTLMRGFPLLLRTGARFTGGLRGATSQIALAQMSRSPRQSIRMTLLLALATAFIIFTLVFNASQTQRIQDVADYQAMADFSGNLPTELLTPQQLVNATKTYAHLPGVFSASMGYIKTVTTGTSALSLPIDFKAVDSSNFAQTARWSTHNSTQTLTNLMHQLTTARTSAIKAGVIPAIVDATTWNELHLTPGANFTLTFSDIGASGLVKFKALTEVQHIPTSGDSSIPAVMVDYLSFADIYIPNSTIASEVTGPLNYVWLHTSDNTAQLNQLRTQLTQSSQALSPLYDRRQIVTQLSTEPLYLTLFGILLLGAITALLLALIGNLVASWLNASSRLANFAALRALGASPGQIAGTLAWEQIVIYTTAILLGFFFGWLLSVLVLPALIFTSILPDQITNSINSQTFYAAQNTPGIQIVIPVTLWIALGSLIALCCIALGMMVRIVSRPSIAQVLRLNED